MKPGKSFWFADLNQTGLAESQLQVRRSVVLTPADDEEDAVGEMIGVTSNPRLRLPPHEHHICKGQSGEVFKRRAVRK